MRTDMKLINDEMWYNNPSESGSIDSQNHPKLAPRTTVPIPSFPSGNSGLVCMFVLDWDPSILSSDYSIPFPVYGRHRYYGEPSTAPWEFNVSDPIGILKYPASKSSKSEFGEYEKKVLASVFGAIAGVVFLGVLFCCYLVTKKRRKKKTRDVTAVRNGGVGGCVGSRAPRMARVPVSETTDLEAPPPTYSEATRNR
jgi:hypothetical protein